jgi:hypothetical protein
VSQTKSKGRPKADQRGSKAAPGFEVLETYEAMLRERVERPEGFDLRHGTAERLALGYYERAKAKAAA